MEKISSILPKSPRTQNVDHSRAQPARPGAPLLGRPMGRVTQKVVFEDMQPDLSFAKKFDVMSPEDRVSLGANDEGPEAKLAGYTRKGELHKVKIAEDINRKFADISLESDNQSALTQDAIAESIDSTETKGS